MIGSMHYEEDPLIVAKLSFTKSVSTQLVSFLLFGYVMQSFISLSLNPRHISTYYNTLLSEYSESRTTTYFSTLSSATGYLLSPYSEPHPMLFSFTHKLWIKMKLY